VKPWGSTTPRERFWKKVKITALGCWTWTGAKQSGGYGNFWDGTRNVLPHRFVLGDVPEDMEVDHLCSNRLCVRPSHLEVVTRDVNVQRQEARNPRPRRRNGTYGHDWNQSALEGLVAQLNG